MSAKSKQIVPGGGAKTLVTVERLMGISRASGQHLIYEATIPGFDFGSGGQQTAKYVKILAQRCPYIFVSFYADETVGNAHGNFRLYEYDNVTYQQVASVVIQKDATIKDHLHVHKVRWGITVPKLRTVNDLPPPDPARFQIAFTDGGSNQTMEKRDLVVGGCFDPAGPFRVTQNGVPYQLYSYSE